MPRGVKGSGKPKTAKKTQVVEVNKPIGAENAVKTRKAYPSYDERIVMADKQIERLTKLNASRAALIEKTEKTLNERKNALEKSTRVLEKVIAKKQRIIANREKPVKAPGVRAAKAVEKLEMEALYAAVKASGKSVEEYIAELNKVD